MKSLHPAFFDLTWNDLKTWAGEEIVQRGRSYRSHVSDLGMTADGALLGRVQGSAPYVTQVTIGKGDELSARCSCPYDWGPTCKHAVALVLVALDTLKKQAPIPEIGPDDERLLLLESEKKTRLDPLAQLAVLEKAAKKQDKSRSKRLRKSLDALDKEEMIQLILAADREFPQIGDDLLRQKTLREGKIDQLVEAIKTRIDSLSAEPGWSNHWSDESEIPDYSPIRQQLSELLQAGYADAVVEIGEFLWPKGLNQAEESDDEGETTEEISQCMEVIWEAVPESSLPIEDQILLIIGMESEDNFGLLDGFPDPFENQDIPATTWGQVADRLQERLTRSADKQGEKSYDRWLRKNLQSWIGHCLEKAGRPDEIIALLKKEAPVTLCYPKLVKALEAAGKADEAHQSALEGIRRCREEAPGTASSLLEMLREMAAREKNDSLVAAYRAFEFFRRPSTASYQALQKASEKTKVWPEVRKAALAWLETGVRPDLPGKTAPTWPLPTPEAVTLLPTETRQKFPNLGALIDIALEEKRHDDAIAWNRAYHRSYRYGKGYDADVAEAVQKSHPDTALELLRQLAEGQISQVKPKAYVVAGSYLRKMLTIYQRENRLAEWQPLIQELRTRHKAKRRLMEVLAGLTGEKIINSL